ncbi:hypothetical protein ABIE65_004892 [Constrictibacter sp. MBR-5]|uniref:hypothetical protein n=1 Tax=Constrictibacter sp. MBR-5 TaxID=3156467 RepID=UPI0033937197
MTEKPNGIPATIAILDTYRGWVTSGAWDRMPKKRRHALLIRLLDHMTEFAQGAEEMRASVAVLLETRQAVREAAAGAGLVEAFVPADTIGPTDGSA